MQKAERAAFEQAEIKWMAERKNLEEDVAVLRAGSVGRLTAEIEAGKRAMRRLEEKLEDKDFTIEAYKKVYFSMQCDLCRDLP